MAAMGIRVCPSRLVLVGAHRGLISLNLGKYQQTASKALEGPIGFTFVVFRDGWNVRRKLNPRLLGGSKDVYIGWQVIWRVERTDAHEPYDRAGTRIVAPYRDATS